MNRFTPRWWDKLIERLVNWWWPVHVRPGQIWVAKAAERFYSKGSEIVTPTEENEPLRFASDIATAVYDASCAGENAYFLEVVRVEDVYVWYNSFILMRQRVPGSPNHYYWESLKVDHKTLRQVLVNEAHWGQLLLYAEPYSALPLKVVQAILMGKVKTREMGEVKWNTFDPM